MRRWLDILMLALVLAIGGFRATEVVAQTSIPAADARQLDDEVGFAILVWQYKTDAVGDAALYQTLNLSGFHIDRGQGQRSRAQWAVDRNWTYYIDHAAGKGVLHLTNRSGLQDVPRDGSPASRPHSFADPSTIDHLRAQLDANLPDAISDRTLAVALDDEVSIGTFNSPLELDYSPESVRAFQSWLREQYRDSESLQSAWPGHSADDKLFDPMTYEAIRTQIVRQSPASWRLAPWMDFRAFNDTQFADAIGIATRHAMQQSKGAPVGFVGAQQPSAYGGFDYSKLRHAVQFIEAYDIGGTNEILHSFWSQTPRKPRMQTYFASGNLSADRWFLWYYLAHGNRGVIVWPTIQGKPWFSEGEIHPHVRALKSTLTDVQTPALGTLSHPMTRPLFDPVAVLVSHASARLGWAIDASAHGKTWPRRSSSLDNGCNSSGKNRVAWTRLLEDLGYQARLIDESELKTDLLSELKTRVLIVPQALALDAQTCEKIKQFANRGGTVIADFLPAITDQHGTGYEESPLADLFGVAGKRSGLDPWFDGRRRYEINGERYNRPFADRISDRDCLTYRDQAIIHRDLRDSWIENPFGQGRAVLINQSPTRFFDNTIRQSAIGDVWRQQLQRVFDSGGVAPDVATKFAGGKVAAGVECLRYVPGNSDRQIWCWVANPTRQASVDGAGKLASVDHEAMTIQVEPSSELRDRIRGIVDLRTGNPLPLQFPLKLTFPGDEASIISVDLTPRSE